MEKLSAGQNSCVAASALQSAWCVLVKSMLEGLRNSQWPENR